MKKNSFQTYCIFIRSQKRLLLHAIYLPLSLPPASLLLLRHYIAKLYTIPGLERMVSLINCFHVYSNKQKQRSSAAGRMDMQSSLVMVVSIAHVYTEIRIDETMCNY
jgi:hypothetical protein